MRRITLPELLDLPGEDYRPFDRYVVTGFLGEGAKAKVLLGIDTLLGREVAIKLSALGAVKSKDENMRFHREAKALAVIDHPNVVRVIDYSGPTCPTPFVITERIKGIDLARLVHDAPLGEHELCATGFMLASALLATHARGIIHRDIKPANAMLDENGRVVLIDFGFCKGLHSEGAAQGNTFVDRPTVTAGTPAFSSPEQLRGLKLTPSTDVFSLGSTLYFLATGVLPFGSQNLIALMRNLVENEPTPLADLIAVSPELVALIAALMAKRPEQRAALLEQVKRDLFNLCARAGQAPDDVLRALALRRNVKPLAPQPVTNLGNDLASVRRVLLLDSFQAMFEDTAALQPTRETKPRARWPWFAAAGAALLALAGVLAWFSHPPRVTVAQPQQVRIAVKPWGHVFVDGVERGVTPTLRVIELMTGPHDIVIEHPRLGTLNRHVDVTHSEDELFLQFDYPKP